jgi:hypothetical protein
MWNNNTKAAIKLNSGHTKRKSHRRSRVKKGNLELEFG